MRENGKLISLVIVLAMVFSGFAALIPMAGAEIINPEDNRDISISSSTINNIPNFNVKPIFPGSQDVTFSITIHNDDGPADTMTDDDPIEWANLSISTTLRDEEGATVTTPISEWDINRRDNEATIDDGHGNQYHTFNGFRFDVKGNAVPGVYNLTVILDYKNDVGTAATYVGYILFDIRNRVEVPNIGILTPGDQNVPVDFPINFDNGISPDEIEDIEISITLPGTDFIWFGESSATITKSDAGPFYWHSEWNFQLKLSVSSSTNKGEHDGTYSVTYTINGVEYTETGDVIFTVGDLPMLDVSVGTATLAQGTSKVAWSLTFTNVGTVDLLDIKAQIYSPTNAFTFSPADHWENDGTVSYDWLELGDIAVGASVTQTMDVGVDLYIPEGIHKVMFKFWGSYYDPDTASYPSVTVDWTWLSYQYVPRVNGVTMDPELSTVTGPCIFITVTDTALDISLTSQSPLQATKLVDQSLLLIVTNYGNIAYTNVILKIETNSATSPFLNVIDEAALFSEETIVGALPPSTHILNDPTALLKVTLKSGVSSGVYSVPVTITGVNADMGESVETTINARVTITGVGPKLEVTAVAPGEIKNGDDFTLTMTITNNGDDTARNVVLSMASNFFYGSGSDINGDLAAPAADALPMYLADIAPGGSLEVVVPMKANKDMSSGHVYVMGFAVDYVDSFGIGPTNSEMSHYVSLKSSGLGGTVIGQFYYSLIILVLIAAICLIAYTAVHVKRYKKENPKGGKAETQTSTYEAPPQPPQETYEEPPPAPPME